MTLNERISVSFKDKITFESALESSEYVLLNEIILGTILGTISDIWIKSFKKLGFENG